MFFVLYVMYMFFFCLCIFIYSFVCLFIYSFIHSFNTYVISFRQYSLKLQDDY